MRVRKNMLDKELKDKYIIGRMIAITFHNQWFAKLILKLSQKFSSGKNIDGLHCEQRYIASRSGGPDIRIRIYKPLNISVELPAMLYIHGGGFMVGQPEGFASQIKNFINAKPCIIVSPDYRKATVEPYPAAFNDCYDTLIWLKENAKSLGAKQDKFIIGGHSAGGGLTAAVALKATDTNEVNIAFQMPVYPMIDYRETASSKDNDAPVWDSKSNQLGWSLYLKGLTKISPYAVPALATDYSKLPPTITYVGSLEPFRDETVTYVENLLKANIPLQFELFEGAFHSFEVVGKNTKIGKRATKFLLDSFKVFVEKYC